MRRLTLALLCGAYLSLALIAALLLWRAGGRWDAGVAVAVAGLGVCFAFHSLISQAIENANVAREIGKIREAQAILIDQLESIDGRVNATVESVADGAIRRSEELSHEVHMLEDLVQRLSIRLDERPRDDRWDAAPRRPHLRDQTSAVLETIRTALADNRVDLYLQPVVSLPQRRTMFYESFTRLRDDTGRVMMPAEYLAVAEPEGLMTAIDNLLLFRCVQIVRRLAKQDRKVGIFCNISLASLGDETFFPQFLDFLGENRDLSGALIFELGQSAFHQRGGIEARNMAKLADLGFRFSLDKVTDLDLDYPDLSRADVKFVKIAADVLLSQLLEVEGRMALKSMRDLQAADFAAITRRYGVEVIAEKVESERQVIDVLELDIGYGQGHLFGEPRAIREAVLAETAPPIEFMHGALRKRAAGGAR